jgi:SOS-response transcriptional repressor LexA
MKSTWYERLKELRKQRGFKQIDIVRAVGVSNATASDWESGKQKPNGENLITLCKFLQTTPDWLMHQKGQQDTMAGAIQLSDPIANVEPGPDMRGMVPIISEVQAGAWAEVIDNGHPFDLGEGGEGLIACPFSHGIRSYALRVTGDSMTSPSGRSYPHGCLIFVDPDQRGGVVSGDRVIAKVNGDNRATFKIYVEDGSRRFLRPLNPQYPIITDEFRILGKVLGGLID